MAIHQTQFCQNVHCLVQCIVNNFYFILHPLSKPPTNCMCPLPVKITPDRLRDTLVQVSFQSNIPLEPFLGLCYKQLIEDGWQYHSRKPVSEGQSGFTLELSIEPEHLFSKDKVRMQILPDSSLVFNCRDGYIGWDAYGPFIQSALDAVVRTGNVTGFTRIGIRYISEFANIDIMDNICLTVHVPFISGRINNSSHRFAFEEDGALKTVNIASKLPVNAVLNNGERVSFVSLLDIDVSRRGLSLNSVAQAWHEIDKLHTSEKQTFFALLKDEFLQTLNPEYA
jgi:uncharacterized protein (TIGR04255 family)